MGDLPRLQPKSRKAWRDWLTKHHAASTGVWLVYAKKGSGLPSLTYGDAVEEALCFGWIDSKINPIDATFYMQVFTPRKPKSAWSALNKTRVERLLAAGLITAAGLAVIKAAKNSGSWNTHTHAEELPSRPFTEEPSRRILTRADTGRLHPGRRKAVLYRLNGAKRPETQPGTFRRSSRTWPAICPLGTLGDGRLQAEAEGVIVTPNSFSPPRSVNTLRPRDAGPRPGAAAS